MKRIGALILLLAVCLFAASFASADSDAVARGDGFAAYTDGDGNLFLAGKEGKINTANADGIAGIDEYRVLFFSPDEFLDTDDLYMIDLESFAETLVTKNVRVACLADEDTAFYVSGSDRTQLTRVNLETLDAQVAYTASEPIDRLYLSAEGLVLQLVDQAGAMLYVQETDSFEPYSADLPHSSLLTGGDELYLTDSSELYLKSGFNYTSTLIDSDVTAYTVMDGSVYYLNRTGSALRLKAYDLTTLTTRVVLTPGVKMENQLTASDHTLFMLTADGSVCTVDTKQGTLAIYKKYADLSPYNLSADYEVEGLRIEAMSGQLNVYAQLRDKNAKPTFSFIEFESESDAASPILKLIDTNKLAAEVTTQNALAPATQYTSLSRGSRGDAVRAIQQPLKDLGYYDYYVDGIFGPRTQAAIQLLQFDLDRPVTGVADAELQKIILSGKLSAYDPYKMLARGNRGLRVKLMQERLRELGYLADAADGIFGPRTLKAVQLFQSENGLQVENTATRDTLKRLYSDTASRCSSYIDLYPGDTGYRVRELNNRLKELYYLECSPGSTYTSATTSAVRMFQRTAGLRETGEATVAVQKVLFSYNAPEAPGYIVLRRGDNNDRVRRLQQRLKDLGYYDSKVDGYFGRKTKDAVALFQKKVGLKPTGVATVRTQQLLFSDSAPVYIKPTVIGEPDIYVDDYDYKEKGVYFISEASTTDGYVIFSWDTEGSVESYNVRIADSMGNVYLDQDTFLTSTGVSLATLDYDVIYTLRVTAYPEDGDRRHITRSEISFARIDNDLEATLLSQVGVPTISIETVARVENGVSYVMPGTVTFNWFAEGDVESYYVEIRDEQDSVVIGATMTDRQASISSKAMNEGEVYTIFVTAIPENGTTDNGRVKFMQFALPVVELPEPDPTPVPTPTPTPEPTPEIPLAPAPEATEVPDVTPEPVATAEATPEPVVDVTPEPAAEETTEPEAIEDVTPETADEMPTTSDEGTEPVIPEDNPETVVPEDSVETVEPEDSAEAAVPEEDAEAVVPDEDAETAIPEDENIPDAVEDEYQEPVEEAEGPDEYSVSEPDIFFDYVEYQQDDISYLSGEIITLGWSAEGDVESYYVELLDSAGNLLDSRILADHSLSAHSEALDPTEVYTLNVTAIPVGGSMENSATSSARFAVYVASVDEGDNLEGEDNVQVPEDNYEETEDEYDAYDDQDDYEGNGYPETEEEYVEPQEEYVEPEEAYTEPEEEYVVPEEAYVEPQEEYAEPEEEYVVPEEEYVVPEEEYVEPEDYQDYDEYTEDYQDYDDYEEDYTEDYQDYGDYEDEYQDYEDEGYEDYDDNEDESYDTDFTADDIAYIQNVLVQLGWLQADVYSVGVMDDYTIEAISSFQNYCIYDLGISLPVIDYSNPVLDADTASLLMSADATFANPYA